MEDRYAMAYEYLIRRCHQIGRFDNNCANADNYRALERATFELKDAERRNQASDISQAQKNFDRELNEIAFCIQSALKKSILKFASEIPAADQITLQQFANSLFPPSLKSIQHVIVKAEAIFVRHKIFPA